MDNENVTTKELEGLVGARRTCGHEFLAASCSDCGNWRTVREGWGELRDRVSYEDLAAEVLAGRTALTAIKERKNQVCDDYELCGHVGCAASYAAFAIADEALAATERSE